MPEVIVTIIRTGKRKLLQLNYGQYMTTCKADDVWSAKKQLKNLPIICPTCRKETKQNEIQ